MDEPEYSIAAVSKLTGISCHALRIWERRHGFPAPARTASGHRRYRRSQVELLQRVGELSRSGRPVGELIEDLRKGSLTVATGGAPHVESGASPDSDRLFAGLLAGDFAAADALFDEFAERLGVPELITRVIVPCLAESGERWFRRECRIYEERCVSGFFRHKIELLINVARQANPRPGHRVVLGSVRGDRHEGGTLLLNLMLERGGWRVINLGSDLPVDEFAQAVGRFRPDALALSFTLSRNVNKRFQELSKIRALPVFVGGRSILNYQGLARRYGLIPLSVPATDVAGPMTAALAEWKPTDGESIPRD